MYQFILLIHVFVAICIVALVLVQQGKGATLGAAYGSGASQTVFGARGSGSFLFRLTLSFIIVFFVTSISLNYLSTRAYKQGHVVTLPMVPVKQSSPISPTTTQPPAQTLPPVNHSGNGAVNGTINEPANTDTNIKMNTNSNTKTNANNNNPTNTNNTNTNDAKTTTIPSAAPSGKHDKS